MVDAAVSHDHVLVGGLKVAADHIVAEFTVGCVGDVQLFADEVAAHIPLDACSPPVLAVDHARAPDGQPLDDAGGFACRVTALKQDALPVHIVHQHILNEDASAGVDMHGSFAVCEPAIGDS